MIGLLVPVDGSDIRRVEVPGHWAAMADVLDCSYVEPVRAWLPGVVLLVDEEGALLTDRVLNTHTARLYPGPIFGAVLVLAEVDTAEGRDLTGLTEDLLSELLRLLGGRPMKLPHRVRIRRVRSSRPLSQFSCPGCGSRAQVATEDAPMWARYHAVNCPDLRRLNELELGCWNCDGAGRVARRVYSRFIAETCLVCQGRGWTTAPDPTRDPR